MSAETHELKTWPVYFQRVWDDEKPFEVRLDDRGYQKGDNVVLREWDRKVTCGCDVAANSDHEISCPRYSGRTITARIGCVIASTPGRGSVRGFFGNGYVVFSLCDMVKVDDRADFVPLTPATSGHDPLAPFRRLAAASGKGASQ